MIAISEDLAMFPASEQCFDFIVATQEGNEKVRGPVLEDETQRDAGATLEQIVPQFANARAAVSVRLAEALIQVA